MKSKRLAQGIALHAAMGIVVVICVFPVLWSCVISVKSVGEKVSGFSALAIQNPTLANYARLFQLVPIGQQLGNSVFTAVVGTVTTLFFCALAGFAFAKYQFPYRDALFYFVVATMTIPAEVGAVPLFLIMKEVGLINSLWSLILPGLTPAFGVFMMRQFASNGVPTETMEAARIEGASETHILFRIAFPMLAPGIFSLAILTFMNTWNDFLWPIIIMNRKENLTVTAMLRSIGDVSMNGGYGILLAAVTLSALPILVMYMAFNKQLVKGIVEGSGKE